MKRFLLIDDHAIVRAALKSQCLEKYPDSVFDESADGKGILQMLSEKVYDLVILDIQIPNCETLTLIHFIHLSHPLVPVLVFSVTSPEIYALRVMKAGARGFVSKVATLEELETAIGLALQGKFVINQEMTSKVLGDNLSGTSSSFSTLSERELQIASLLLSGHSVTVIAKLLTLCLSTVGTHKANIYSKLRVNNLLELKEISDLYKF
jgi:two-component system invasion response regulator UvrY